MKMEFDYIFANFLDVERRYVGPYPVTLTFRKSYRLKSPACPNNSTKHWKPYPMCKCVVTWTQFQPNLILDTTFISSERTTFISSKCRMTNYRTCGKRQQQRAPPPNLNTDRGLKPFQSVQRERVRFFISDLLLFGPFRNGKTLQCTNVTQGTNLIRRGWSRVLHPQQVGICHVVTLAKYRKKT